MNSTGENVAKNFFEEQSNAKGVFHAVHFL